jgi:hypothetical protein
VQVAREERPEPDVALGLRLEQRGELGDIAVGREERGAVLASRRLHRRCVTAPTPSSCSAMGSSRRGSRSSSTSSAPLLRSFQM